MLELGTFGSVRGVPGNGYPYRNPRSTTASQSTMLAVRYAARSCRSPLEWRVRVGQASLTCVD
jgi:hypothetical protein